MLVEWTRGYKTMKAADIYEQSVLHAFLYLLSTRNLWNRRGYLTTFHKRPRRHIKELIKILSYLMAEYQQGFTKASSHFFLFLTHRKKTPM